MTAGGGSSGGGVGWDSTGISADEPVYVISVAAELAGMHAQTLRTYDREGLVSPGRAAGGGRRYSRRDIEMLREMQRLSQQDGVNRSGIRRIVDLESRANALRRRLAEMQRENVALQREVAALRRAVAAAQAGSGRDVVLHTQAGRSVVRWQR